MSKDRQPYHPTAEGICGDPMRNLYRLVQSGANEEAVMSALLAEGDSVRRQFIQSMQPELMALMEERGKRVPNESATLKPPEEVFMIPGNDQLSASQKKALGAWCAEHRDWIKQLDPAMCLALCLTTRTKDHRSHGLELARGRNDAIAVIAAAQGGRAVKIKGLKLPEPVKTALQTVKATPEERRIVEYMLVKRATIGGKEGEKMRPVETALFLDNAVFNMNEGSLPADSLTARLEGLDGDVRIDRAILFQTSSINPQTPGRQGSKVMCYKLHYPEATQYS